MSKKILKRSLALGALMAFVITGSAMAAELELMSDTSVQVHTPSPYQHTTSKYYGNAYTLGDTKVELISNGTPNVVLGRQNEVTTVHVEENQTLRLEGNSGSEFGLIQDTTITGNGIVEIIQNNSGWGASAIGTNYMSGNQVSITANKIVLQSGYDAIYATSTGDSVTLDAQIINITSDSVPVYAAVDSKVNILASNRIDINITDGSDSTTAVSSGQNSGVFINSKNGGTKADIVINGDVRTVGAGDLTIKLETEKSALNGRVKTYDNSNDGSVRDLTLANGAQWNNTGVSNATSLTLDGGIVNQTSGDNVITVGTMSGEGTLNVADAKAGQMVVGDATDAKLTVATDAENVSLEDLTKVATTNNGTESAAQTVKIVGGSVYDEQTADVTGLGTVANVDKQVAAANVSVNDMAAIGLMSWRAEMNDMNKRMGELRNANGEHGVWVRMVRGESEYNSVKNQYNQYQLGYDEKLSVDKRWTVGVALSYTDAENNFAQGTGESTNKALSVYGSKLNDDGTFIDLIAKYARLENDFTVQGGQGDADYDTNAYSFSAEAGKRIQQGKGLWIEPQVELTYGKVSAVDYVTKNDVKVAQDGMESLVGRIGFSLGKDIEKGNVYARASYLYDFDGETKATLNNDAVLENDLGGGWWEVGVGANINLSKATYIYADIEKTFGGEVDTNWQWNLGVRYSF